MPISVFDVTSTEVAALPPAEAVSALRDILISHARKIGVPFTAVNVPGAVNVRDGGVDADIHCPSGIVVSGDVLFGGLTCYQVKTGSFSASTLRDIKSILLRPSSLNKRHLKSADLNDRVKGCLDVNGTFIITLFGSESVERTTNSTANKFREFLKRIDVAYANAKIRIWRANQLAALLSEIPGTALHLKGLSALNAFVHDWGWMEKSCGFDGSQFLETARHVDAISGIRAAARGTERFSHIRVLGEPGCGKTRLVFEALREPDIIPFVVYCVDGALMLENGVVETLQQQAKIVPMVLVIDECDSNASFRTQQILKNSTHNMTLITIYNEENIADRSDQNISLIDAPILTVDQVAQVIETYGVPADRARAVASLCDGSPRVAHGVGASMQRASSSGAIVELDSLSRIWDSYIAGRDGPEHPDYRDRVVVLTCVALFKKFGWEGVHSNEARLILEQLIRQIEPGMSWAKFSAAIEHFRSRRVLQGNTTLYLTPRLLHIKLWVDWWNHHSRAVDVLAILEQLPRELQEWVQSMFIYARESSAATDVVNRILDPSGPYGSLSGFMSRSSSTLFFTVAQVNPRAAAHRILTALEGSSREELLQFGDGRRSVIHALEHIAVFEDGFLDAAYCLMRLAEAENETWSNNATGVFADLFSLGYGPIASTEMAPQLRLPFLELHIKSEALKTRQLVLKAYDSALRTTTSRTSLGETHGLRPMPRRWMPATYGDLFGAYLLYLNALYKEIPSLSNAEAKTAIKIITDNARPLIRMPSVAPRLLSILKEVASRDSASATVVIETIVSILHFDRIEMADSAIGELQGLYDTLVGQSFDGRLRRYVSLDLIEDKFNQEGKHEDQAEIAMRPLAEEALAQPALLTAQLPWLVTEQAKNGYAFGRLLGLSDNNLSVWEDIRTAWINGNCGSDFFIGGYLSGIFQLNQESWERELRRIAEDPELVSQFPILLWRSGMSAEMAALLLDVMRDGRTNLVQMRMFVFGAVVHQIPAQILNELLSLLIVEGGRRTAEVAVELLASIYREGKSVPEGIGQTAFRVLDNDALFRGEKGARADNMLDFYWREAAMRLLGEEPNQALGLAKKAIQYFGSEGSIFGAFRPSSLEFLDQCVERFPGTMWETIAKFLQPPLDGRAYTIFQWLRGDDRPGRAEKIAPVFTKFPQKVVLDWISEDLAKRSLTIAHFVPPSIGDTGFKQSLARAILVKYGSDKSVRSAFHANYNTGMWWGSSAQHNRQKRDQLHALLVTEDDRNVRRWIDEELRSLEIQIKVDDENEEREDL